MKWLIIGLLAIVVLALAAIYFPPTQRLIISKVLSSINSGGSMTIDARELRLRFPLAVEARQLRLSTASKLEVNVGRADVDVDLMPLLTGTIRVGLVSVDSAYVGIGTPDSTLYLQARLATAQIRGTDLRLASTDLDISRADLKGGRVFIALRPDTTEKAPSTQPASWKIKLRHARLDDVDYSMTMLPTIDSLSVSLGRGLIDKGLVDLAKNLVEVDKVEISAVDALYLTPPTSAEIATEASPKAQPDTIPSQPMLVKVNKILLTDSHAVYATAGVSPSPGFDPQYIEASDIRIEVDSLRNRGTELRVPLKDLSATERCGLPLHASGLFAMDSLAMRATDFRISTIQSAFSLDATLGLGDLAADPSLPVALQLRGDLSPSDVATLLPVTSRLMDAMPRRTPLRLVADISGSTSHLTVGRLSAELPLHLSIVAGGWVDNAFDPDRLAANVDISGRVINADFLRPALVDPKSQMAIEVPPLTLTGDLRASDGTYTGHLKGHTGDGDLALNASWNGLREDYDATLSASCFPIQSILPTLGISDVSADVDLKGHGYDPFSAKTAIDARAHVASMRMGRTPLRDILLEASLSHGEADLVLSSSNPAANLSVHGRGNLAGDTLRWELWGDIHRLNLFALSLSDTTAMAMASFSADAVAVPARRSLVADLNVENLRWSGPGIELNTTDILGHFAGNDSTTSLRIVNHDLTADLTADCAIDSIAPRLTSAMACVQRGIRDRQLDVDSIHSLLPPFSFDLSAGPYNALQSLINETDNSFRSLSLTASNMERIRLDAKLLRLRLGTTDLDTITATVLQMGDALLFRSNLDNAPGTLDQFAHVVGRGFVAKNRAGIHLEQTDARGRTGYKLALQATMPDSNLVHINFSLLDPIIGYKDWTINQDNYIDIDLAKRHLDADLRMKSAESSIALFTEHVDGTSDQEDIVLRLADIQLADWIEINPFAPPLKGNLSADMRLKWDGGDLDGNGNVQLADLFYGRSRVGTFGLDLSLFTNRSGVIRAHTSLAVDGVPTIEASGNLNDTAAANPFLLDLAMNRFPLRIVNPFLPPNTATLSGTLSGDMDVTGSVAHPVLNGKLCFDSTAIKVGILGSSFGFSPDSIPVADNVVRFNRYAISTLNSNPLTIDGSVDLHDLISPRIDLQLTAQNAQIVNSSRAKGGASVYGKAFIGLDASAHGSLDRLRVDASLDLLPPTNVTYVMTDAQQVLASRQNSDMVRFVNFADITAMSRADTVATTSMALDLAASLNISTGTTVNVDLSADGKNKVQLQSNGNLNFTLDALNGEQLTGRLNISEGFARYTPPLMTEKLFKFLEGSYVSFSGDMLDPVVNLRAVDQMRVNVTPEGQNSRLVDFDVSLAVTGTLDNMNVAFDLSSPDDLTVENELQSMSPEQRANQAMNLLLYGMYTGPGTQATASSANLTGRLYSFLASTLNTWVANNIRGVDISFGVNQYDQTIDGATSTAMTYSYRVSKSLFDDRFKIVVGGNYNTNPDADENFTQNLIDDISFEYLLNKSGSMMVKLFRHSGYESILEGEVIQTGVGFVYKRKIRRLSDIFHLRKASDAAPPLPQQGTPLPVARTPKTLTTDETTH